MRIQSWTLAVAYLFNQWALADHQPISQVALPADPLDHLVINVNPLSPSHCGVKLIEVGFRNHETQTPDFHLALLRDVYDSSFGPLPPQIRKVYDYNMPVDSKFWSASSSPEDAEEPYDIINRATRRKQIVAKIVWDLAQFVASSVPFVGAAYYVTDELVDAYVRRNQFHRRQTTQLLNTIIENRPQAFQNIVSLDEVKNIVGTGEEYTLGGLFVNRAVAELVWQYNQDSRNSLRAQNYSRLINILSREGLEARPISRDFLVVYYNPNKAYAREFETLYTDLDDLPKISGHQNGGELVPLGIYGIGQLDQRILTTDFTDHDRIRNRKALKYLVDLGVKAGSSFLPLPFNIIVSAANKAIRFTLNKHGTNLLTDVIQNEAELAMLLQTGIAQLSPQIIDDAKAHLKHQQLNILIKADGSPERNRQKNSVQVNNFLRYNGEELCNDVGSERENEYRQSFLSWWERVGRTFSSLWPFSSKTKLERERQDVIAQRFDLVKARYILRYYDSTRRNYPDNEVITALQAVALAKNEDDVQLIAKLIEYPGTETIELAAVRAARVHQDPDLVYALMKFLESYDFDAEILRNDKSLSSAFAALLALDYAEAMQPVPRYDLAINFVEKKMQEPQLADAKSDLKKIAEQITFKRNVYVERQWQGY